MQELQNTADWQSETSDGSILGEKNQRNIFAELYIPAQTYVVFSILWHGPHFCASDHAENRVFVMAALPIHQPKSA